MTHNQRKCEMKSYNEFKVVKRVCREFVLTTGIKA